MLKLQKGFTSFGGYLILLIGVALLGFAIWGFINSALTFNNNTFLGVLFAFDLLVILAAVLGICGVKKQNGFMICVFQVFVMLFVLVFFVIGITAKFLPGIVFQGTCNNSTNPLINAAYNVSRQSVLLCTSFCPCGLTDAAIAKANYSSTDMFVINSFNRTSTALRFQDCPISKALPQQQQDAMNVLQSIQTGFDCSGWCNTGYVWPIYTFSNVNNGRPKSACYDTMKSKLQKYGSIFGISCLVAAGFLMLVCICGLCVCCAPKNRSMPYSSRFAVNDNGFYRAA